MPATRPSAALGVSSSSSRASSRSRPVKLAVSRGRVLEAAAAAAPGATSCTAASTSAAGPRPRAAATNSARTGPARPSASASSPAVSLWAVRWIPRSRSLTDRGERPAASASSSWVSFASVRNCRSNPANPGPGCSATAPAPFENPPATTGPPRAGPTPKAYADPITAATRCDPRRGTGRHGMDRRRYVQPGRAQDGEGSDATACSGGLDDRSRAWPARRRWRRPARSRPW